jgi:hypothetical protein
MRLSRVVASRRQLSCLTLALLDGQNIGVSEIFSNGTGTHRATVPAYLEVQLQFGDHTLVLVPNTSDTLSDGNDFYTAVLHY